MKSFFFLGGCGACGSTPHINCSVAAWHASWPYVLFWLADGSRFRWNLSAYPCFLRQIFLTLAFLPCAFCSLSSQFLPSLRYTLFYAFSFWSFIAFLSLCSYFLFKVVLFRLVVDYSEIRRTSPSVAFFFARLGALIDSSSDQLGALLDSSSDQCLRIGDFVIDDSSFGLVFGNLYPLLC